MFTPICGFWSKPNILGSWMKTSTYVRSAAAFGTYEIWFLRSPTVLGSLEPSFILSLSNLWRCSKLWPHFGFVSSAEHLPVKPHMHFAPKHLVLHLLTPGKTRPICFSFIYTLLIKMLVLVGFLCFCFKKLLRMQSREKMGD